MVGIENNKDSDDSQAWFQFDGNYQDPDGWPDAERFPYNWSGEKVKNHVEADLLGSPRPLVVTGYSSLEKVIEFLARHQGKEHHDRQVRLLFGHEPQMSLDRGGADLNPIAVSSAMRDYWLEQNVNPLQIVNLFDAIQYVKSGTVQIRFPQKNRPMMHAKMYIGKHASTLGSSNFTEAGLGKNLEANARFPIERAKFWKEGVDQLAERLWEDSEDDTAAFIKLLESLLREVDWETALARACAELLGDDWLKDTREKFGAYDGHKLWPTQEEGIARALCVLRTSGAVLVADAAGSGKTKTGAHLLRHLTFGLVSESQARKDLLVLITPPDSVKEGWDAELTDCGVSAQVHSYGLLSRGLESRREQIQRALQRGSILAIDEAHRFYGRDAERARQVRNNLADYVLLFTATPINCGIQDLVSLVDLLGADNISDQTHRVLEQLWRAKNSDKLLDSLSESEINLLRREIRNFTVRRTRAQLSDRIDLDPDAYRDRLGRKCRYPKPITENYNTLETSGDKRIAGEIRTLAKQLKGIHYFKTDLAVPESLQKDRETDQGYLQQRMASATALTQWLIAESLRSSRAALIEHLQGTGAAVKKLSISGYRKADSGNVIHSVRNLMRPPQSKLNAELPKWLESVDEFQKAKENEIALLHQIADLALQLSRAREQGKAELLIDRAESSTRVLAFDHHPITLHVIAGILKEKDCPRVHVVRADKKSRRLAEKICALDHHNESAVVLCSDALAEGVNLQGASVMVHLDKPSVIRIAEQRAGRIMRMDSPHEEVSILWPSDSEAFDLKGTGEKLISRHRLTSVLLGANIDLPFGRIDDEPTNSPSTTNEDRLDEVHDVFEAVESLVGGDHAVVSPKLYQEMQGSDARVVSAVSVVKSSSCAWAFLCLRGGRFRPPRWIYLNENASTLETNLTEIAEALREHFSGEITRLKFSREAAESLNSFMQMIREKDFELLPPLKQRALKQMRKVISKLIKQDEGSSDTQRLNWLRQIKEWVDRREVEDAPDISALADAWLTLIQPTWGKLIREKARRRPLRLNDPKLINLLTGERSPSALNLQNAFGAIPSRSTNESRIAAAIIGIPD